MNFNHLLFVDTEHVSMILQCGSQCYDILFDALKIHYLFKSTTSIFLCDQIDIFFKLIDQFNSLIYLCNGHHI